MYLRIYWGRIVPDKWDLVQQRYADLMKVEMDGLLGRFVTQDTNDPENLYTVTLWRDLNSLREWENSPAYRDVFLKAIEPYLVGSHSVSLCEVKLHELGGLFPAGQQLE